MIPSDLGSSSGSSGGSRHRQSHPAMLLPRPNHENGPSNKKTRSDLTPREENRDVGSHERVRSRYAEGRADPGGSGFRVGQGGSPGHRVRRPGGGQRRDQGTGTRSDERDEATGAGGGEESKETASRDPGGAHRTRGQDSGGPHRTRGQDPGRAHRTRGQDSGPGFRRSTPNSRPGSRGSTPNSRSGFRRSTPNSRPGFRRSAPNSRPRFRRSAPNSRPRSPRSGSAWRASRHTCTSCSWLRPCLSSVSSWHWIAFCSSPWEP